MKFTVLGKYGPYPGRGGACSGYLLESEDTKVLIDCGNGVLSRLQQICDINDLHAIILSHLHSDHISDMMVLRYALDIWTMRGMRHKTPLPVYLPGSPAEEYNRIAVAAAFKAVVIEEGMVLPLGNLSFTFREMTHPVQSFGMAVTDGQKRMVYTGDTNLNPHIAEFARDADLLLADTGLLMRDKRDDKAPHLTADEVGRIAQEANVGTLMLTHIWPEYKEDDLMREAAAHFSNLQMAVEMRTYTV